MDCQQTFHDIMQIRLSYSENAGSKISTPRTLCELFRTFLSSRCFSNINSASPAQKNQETVSKEPQKPTETNTVYVTSVCIREGIHKSTLNLLVRAMSLLA